MKKVKFTKKAAALVVASVMLVGGVGTGTLAWLMDETDVVSNQFTKSDVEVSLTESDTNPETPAIEHEYKMIPGWKNVKDPKAKANGEDCYMFVKVEKQGGNITIGEHTYSFDDFIKYEIDSQWTVVLGETNVYYMKIDDTEGHLKDTEYNILGQGTYDNNTPNDPTDDFSWNDSEVFVLPTVTKEMMNGITDANRPKLNFTAYAMQLWKTNKPNRSEYAEGEAGTAAYNAAVTAAQFTPEEAWNQIK